MKNSNIQICDAVIYPGEQANLALALPELYSCAPLYMPIKIIHGKSAGPCLLIFSALSGNELNGFEIINRLINDYDLSKNLCGTLIAIPVLNVFGLTQIANEAPAEISLEQSFPGDEMGSFGERVAHLFVQEILRKAEYCIALKTGELNHSILPQIYCDLDEPKIKNLARNFQVPVVAHIDMVDNPLNRMIKDLGISLLVYEAGEALRFDENAIQIGINGILNTLRALNMLPEESSNLDVKTCFCQNQEWIRSPKGGVLMSKVDLGQMVAEGEVLGHINDPFGNAAQEAVHAPQDGIIVGINNHPLLHEGQATYRLASFIDNERAGNTIEKWEEQANYNPT